MKYLLVSVAMLFLANFSFAQQRKEAPQKFSGIVEAACGQCQFGVKGEGCSLAVKIDNHVYFVDGTKIDDHGDAHAADGFCNAVRKANVKGKIVNGRFKANTFRLLPSNKN